MTPHESLVLRHLTIVPRCALKVSHLSGIPWKMVAKICDNLHAAGQIRKKQSGGETAYLKFNPRKGRQSRSIT